MPPPVVASSSQAHSLPRSPLSPSGPGGRGGYKGPARGSVRGGIRGRGGRRPTVRNNAAGGAPLPREHELPSHAGPSSETVQMPTPASKSLLSRMGIEDTVPRADAQVQEATSATTQSLLNRIEQAKRGSIAIPKATPAPSVTVDPESPLTPKSAVSEKSKATAKAPLQIKGAASSNRPAAGRKFSHSAKPSMSITPVTPSSLPMKPVASSSQQPPISAPPTRTTFPIAQTERPSSALATSTTKEAPARQVSPAPVLNWADDTDDDSLPDLDDWNISGAPIVVDNSEETSSLTDQTSGTDDAVEVEIAGPSAVQIVDASEEQLTPTAARNDGPPTTRRKRGQGKKNKKNEALALIANTEGVRHSSTAEAATVLTHTRRAISETPSPSLDGISETSLSTPTVTRSKAFALPASMGQSEVAPSLPTATPSPGLPASQSPTPKVRPRSPPIAEAVIVPALATPSTEQMNGRASYRSPSLRGEFPVGNSRGVSSTAISSSFTVAPEGTHARAGPNPIGSHPAGLPRKPNHLPPTAPRAHGPAHGKPPRAERPITLPKKHARPVITADAITRLTRGLTIVPKDISAAGAAAKTAAASDS